MYILLVDNLEISQILCMRNYSQHIECPLYLHLIFHWPLVRLSHERDDGGDVTR